MYKIGMIGFGGMAHEHYKNLLRSNRAQVKGVYDIEPEPMADAKSKNLLAYSSQEAMLSDDEIDIILVATTNECHKDICIAALEAGKHVICEKPVTLNSSELEEIIAAAKRCGRIFTIDQNRRTNHDFQQMKQHVEAGEIGKVYQIESCVEGSRGMPEGWRCNVSQGGGMLLDWGVHLIDQIMWMYANQKVTSVTCRFFSINYPEIDDNFNMCLTFEDGLTAYIRVGTNDFIAHPRWHVLGTRGTLEIPDWDCKGKIIRSIADEKVWANEIVMTKAGPTKTMAPRNKLSTETLQLDEPDNQDDLLVVYDSLFNAIEGTGKLWVQPEEALRVMKVIDAGFESAQNNCVVHTAI